MDFKNIGDRLSVFLINGNSFCDVTYNYRLGKVLRKGVVLLSIVLRDNMMEKMIVDATFILLHM